MNRPADQDQPAEATEGDRLCVQLVTRRFWPYSGNTEFQVAEIAEAISQLGHHVEVLTVRWEKDWPSHFRFRKYDVCRINRPTAGPWGSYRYLKNLNRQIVAQAPDRLVVFGLGEELMSISKNLDGSIPYSLCLNEFDLGLRSDAHHLSSRMKQAICNAHQIIVESDWTADRLRTISGIDLEKLVLAADGIANVSPMRSPTSANVARRALADAHPMLATFPHEPLAICVAPMIGDRGLIDMVQAWQRVVRKHPGSRLWMVGEGVHSRQVWNAVTDHQVSETLIMPGQFDDMDEMFQAADLVIHPLRQPVHCGMLKRAIASGLCPLVTAATAQQLQLIDQQDAFVLQQQDSEGLSAGILACFRSIENCHKLGKAASAKMAAFSIDSRISTYLS